MEPITPLGAAVAISALAGKVWDVGRYIHNVYQGTKTVNIRIKKLSSEVHGLASTCDLIHAGLAPVLEGATSEKHGRPYDHDGILEKSICSQVAHCESTIEELGKIAERLWPHKKKFVDRTVRELRLQDAKEHIDDLRARIRSHTDALHTVLLVLSIQVAHISPVQALRQLPDDLGDLRESILRIEATLKPPSLRDGIVGCSMPTLVEYARGTLQSGMTLLNDSLAGSTVGVDSVIGDEQAAATDKKVADWIASPGRTGNERQDALSTPPKHFADANVHAPDYLESSNRGPDCDSDDEKVEFAEAAMKAGSSAYYKQDWPSASKFYITSKKTVTELPVSRWRLGALLRLQYRIALCSYCCGFHNSAESELQEILQLEPDSDEQRIGLCDTHHLLALVYLHQNKLNAAKEVCKRTLNARSRLLGKQHASRLQSIALLSRICELLGETADSEVYLFMIPDDQKERFTASFRDIRPSIMDEVAPSQPTTTQAPSSTKERIDHPVRVTVCGQPLPKTDPLTPIIGSREAGSCARQPSNETGSRIDPSQKATIPNLSTQGRDLQGYGAAQPKPSSDSPLPGTTLRNRQTPRSSRTALNPVGEAEATAVRPNVTSVTPFRRRRAAPLPANVASEVATVLPEPLEEAEQTPMRRKVTPVAPPRRRTRRATALPAKRAFEVGPFLSPPLRDYRPKLPDEMRSMILAIRLDDANAVNDLLETGHERVLMSAKADDDNEPLDIAIGRAIHNTRLPLDIVRSLLEHGAYLEGCDIRWQERVRRGRHRALASGHDDLVGLFTSHAARVALQHSKEQKE
jgi:hypothetical protein